MYLTVAGCNLKMDCSHVVTYQIWVLAHFIRDRAQERDIHIQSELFFKRTISV